MTFKALLELNNYTGYRLFKETGITQATISGWNTGRSDAINMPLSSAKKIADCFKITIDELYAKLDRED